MWNIYGGLLILTMAGNIFTSIFNQAQEKLKLIYLTLSSLGLMVVMLMNTVVSLSPTNESSRSAVSMSLMLLLLITGGVMNREALLHRLHANNKVYGFRFTAKSKGKKLARVILIVVLSLSLLAGLLLAFVMLFNPDVSLLEIIISQYSLFYSFIFLSCSGLLLKLSRLDWQSIKGASVLLIGNGLFLVFSLPLITTPSLLNESEASYTEAFGDEWRTFDDEVPEFSQRPVSIPAYFFGIQSEPYNLTEDIFYYEGTEGVDDGLELRFDVYTPLAEAQNLPGEGSTLVRIHGGGWNTGSKGAENFAQVNKYFAAQGYVVFDVQYGLNDQDQFVNLADVPDEVSGEFSIDDMVRHLGEFTTYLADNHEDFGASIDSVFFSGGSAGGHLANAVALGLASGQYTDILDERLTVSGIIPIYPANGLAGYQEINGEDDLVDPALLVDENSPPALVYQGDHDKIVDPRVADLFEEAYLNNGNTDIAVIRLPYGEHASDLNFPGFYSQIFMYYMERFMYQYK
ncbi:alpha/beta hydrolase [Alkalibacterium pelagium]|nr:alpha/beta hydrolase [Alkalibacterium pelagium]